MLSNTATPYEYGYFRDSVLAGEIPICEEIALQMARIDDDIANPEFYYDDQAINGYVNFCESELTLTDGDDLFLLPSFKLWAEDLLAWYWFPTEKRWNNVTREYEYKRRKKRLRNKQFLIVGRGAAKSLYGSSIQSYGLTVDIKTTKGVTVAPTIKQSEEVLDPIRTAISRARGPMFKFLTKGSNKSRSTYSQASLASTKKGIENKISNSIIESRPMRVDKLQGLRNKYNTIDEWLSGDIKEDVIGAIEQGASKIDDYIIVAMSSEGNVRNSIGDTIKMELMDILRGDYFNPHVSIFFYKMNDVSEIADPRLWPMCNPNIGASVSYETYQRDVERAESQPATRNDILAKRFGLPTEGFTYFFNYEETLLHRPQDFDGLECTMGMDASQGDDFWAFSWFFPLGNERFGIKNRAYVSEVKYLELPQATKAKYDELVEEGTLVIMPGAILDWYKVFDDVDEHIMEHQYDIIAFGYDPYNARDFVERYVRENGELGLTKVIQGAKTESVPLGELKNLAKIRKLIFDEELMKFAMGNAIAIKDNNSNYKLSKKRNIEKIDNVASTLDAYIAYKRNQEAFM